MRSLVLKFGGSSVGSPQSIELVIEILSALPATGTSVRAVVVSAFQGVTDLLIACASAAAKRESSFHDILKGLEERHLAAVNHLLPAKHRSAVLASTKVLLNELGEVLHGITLVGECTPRSLDLIMSFGERISASIVTAALIARNIECKFLDMRTVLRTDEEFGATNLDKNVSYDLIVQHFANHPSMQIATGFIASSSSGATTTLGRGGSDYTASLIGAALRVDEIQIWTDVDGMLTCDPRKVRKAFPIPAVSVEEAMELCHFGAKVIYPPTIQPAVDSGVPLVIKNTFNPSAPGTRICTDAVPHPYPITGISSISKITLLRIQGSGMVGVAGVAKRFFGALATSRINVILITQASSEHTICCAITPSESSRATECVHAEFSLEIQAGLIQPLIVEDSLSIISVVGERMKQTPGISGRVFSALGVNGVNVVAIAQGSSELNISAVVYAKDEVKALNALHDEFFTGSSKTLHLWIVGTGLIGKTLLRQLTEKRDHIKSSQSLDIVIHGLANSRRMRLGDGSGGSVDTGTPLSQNDAATEMSSFIEHILTQNLPNSLFVDCTSNEHIPSCYPTLLEKNVAVVTPNKKSISGSLADYLKVKEIARRRRIPFLHETCVGAALPVLSTLNDLVRSGDSVLRIEAVLSGTLSYIFNSLSEESPFSQCVLRAKELGLTEPDPRDDLSGRDVARKVLILAREAGVNLELSDVVIKPLLPNATAEWSTEEFFSRLSELDPYFDALYGAAQGKGARLCFLATVDCCMKSATIELLDVPPAHPFSALQGSDNIISFTSSRYHTQPLVVRGPGAGAEVTAAGVLADIIRVAR